LEQISFCKTVKMGAAEELELMRAEMKKELMEEVEDAMEVRLRNIEEREKTWRGERAEALAHLEKEKEVVRADLLAEIHKKGESLAAKLDKVKQSVKDEMREELATKACLREAVETVPGAVKSVVGSLPVLLISAFKNEWSQPDSTITYDSFLTNHNRGANAGELDLKTGVFTCAQAGHFTVTFSAYAQLQPGEGVWLHLAHQGEEVVESKWRHKVSDGAVGSWLYCQGCRSVTVHLKRGETLQVMERKESNGKLWQFTLTIALDCLD